MLRSTQLLAVCVTGFIVGLSNAQSLTVGSATADPGDTVCLDVTIGDIMGMTHSNTAVQLDFDTPPLSNLTIDGSGSIYTGATFNVTGNTAQSPTSTPTTAEGLVFMVCFDVDATATAGTYPVEIIGEELFSGIFSPNGSFFPSTTYNDGSVTVVPEPLSSAMALASLLLGLGMFRKRYSF